MSHQGEKRRKNQGCQECGWVVKTVGTQSGNQHEPREKRLQKIMGKKARTIM